MLSVALDERQLWKAWNHDHTDQKQPQHAQAKPEHSPNPTASRPTRYGHPECDRWCTDKRSSACVMAVAGTHAPGRSEGVEGLGRWLGDIINAVSCCRGWKGQKTMPSGGKVDDTHAPGRGGELDKVCV